MTWEIVAGLAVLIGMFATVVGWSNKLAVSIATLQATIDNLTKSIEGMKQDNKDEHNKMVTQIDDHEKRITILEQA